MNKTCSGDFHTCAESKNAFVLAEERKTEGQIKAQKLRSHRTINLERLMMEIIKNKYSKQKGKDQQSNKNYSGMKIRP